MGNRWVLSHSFSSFAWTTFSLSVASLCYFGKADLNYWLKARLSLSGSWEHR